MSCSKNILHDPLKTTLALGMSKTSPLLEKIKTINMAALIIMRLKIYF